MGIKSIVTRTAGRAGNAIAKASSLSPEQLGQVEAKREAYLSEMPNPSDSVAEELTKRLLAACGIEIHSAYLSQLDSIYVPLDPTIEYGGEFNPVNNIRYLNITKWVVDPDENSLEKLVNVYDVLSEEDCSIALIFNRTRRQTNVYIAVVDAMNNVSNKGVENYRRRITESLQGNFPGSEVTLGDPGRPPCLVSERPMSVAIISNVPAEKSEKFASQTIEKVLDGVVPSKGKEEYTIILLATPARDIEERKLRLAELYTALAPYAGWQTDYRYTESDSVMSMATVGVNAGVSAGIQSGTNSSTTSTDSTTDSTGSSVTDSTGSTTTDTTGTTDTAQSGTSESATEGESATGGASFIINGSTTGSSSATTGTSTSTSHADSVSKAVGQTVGRAVANTLGKAVTSGLSKTAGVFSAVNYGANFGVSFARASSVTATIGKNEGITQSFTNFAIKHALDVLEKQMARLEQASALGMWDFAAYVLSEDHVTASNVAHSYLALTQGEESFVSQAAVNRWRGDITETEDAALAICQYLRDLRHPMFSLNPSLLDLDEDYSAYPTVVNATTALSGKELAYSLNFPNSSVPGLPVIECAEFGRNVVTFDGANPKGEEIVLGKVFHMHREEPVDVALDLQSLASHMFVTGSTGAGKTNTVCRILDEATRKDIKFLVIEPAKGEYKDVYGGCAGVSVYGTNQALAPLLRINPFGFPRDVHVLEHLDRLVEIFNVCWPMYAAMPAVLKSAIEAAYVDCGWDLVESSNRYGDKLFPTFADVARNVRTIIDASEYDTENKGAYKGSLLTRLQSLTNGINGLIFGSEEIPDVALFDSNVIVDLSRVGSMETKALLMGMLVLKLQEYRMVTSGGSNLPLRHLTVLEEAHNLLKRTSGEQPVEGGNLMGKSVEMLSNAIAEMRTYGEGFIIADQAPGLLDMSAIRNTNTKVIMRLPDLSDRELVGRAASLNDSQIVETARLPMGVAAVYQNDWVQPVLCKVRKAREGSPLSYERVQSLRVEPDPKDSLLIAEVLAKGAPIDDEVRLRELGEAMRRVNLSASMRVMVLDAIENPQDKPRMTRIAPVMAALFPGAREAVASTYRRTKDKKEWTFATERTLASFVGTDIDEHVRRVIVQAIITDYVFNEMRDEKGLRDWSRS